MINPALATRIICLSVIYLLSLRSQAQTSKFFILPDTLLSSYQVSASIPAHLIDEPYKNGLVVASGVNHVAATFSEILIRCFDKCENLLWTSSYALPAKGLQFADMEVTEDGHIIVTGQFEDAYTDIFVLKVTIEGEVIFLKSYTTPPGEYAYSIDEAENGDYLIRGNTMVNMSIVSRNFVLRTFSNGEINWSKMYFSIPIWGRSTPTKDNGMISITGNVVYKLDEDGNLQWAKTLNVGSFYITMPVEVDDGYVFGRYRSWGLTDPHGFAFKLDKVGNLVWKTDAFNASSLQRPVVLQNGHIVFPGVVVIDTINEVSTHTFLTEIDQDGNLLNHAVVSLMGDNATYQPFLSISENTMRLVGYSGAEGSVLNFKTFVFRLSQEDWLNSCVLRKVELPIAISTITMEDHPFESTDLEMSVLDHPVEKTIIDESLETLCEIIEPLSIDIGADSIFCANDSVSLAVKGDFDKITWSTGESGSSIQVSEGGSYWVEVEDQCRIAVDTVVVASYDPVVPRYSVSPVKTTPLEEVSFQSLNDEPGTLFWIINSDTIFQNSMELYFDENGIHEFCYGFMDTNGCVTKRPFNIEVDYFSYFIPNTFSPNQDGSNDLFYPQGFGIVHYEMQIFNQWGDRIFHKENTPWDGTVDGRKVPNEVYVYKILIESYQGEQHSTTGRILVL